MLRLSGFELYSRWVHLTSAVWKENLSHTISALQLDLPVDCMSAEGAMDPREPRERERRVNLVPNALFTGFPTSKARERAPTRGS